MAALVRAFDWSQTPLGPIDEWPQNLKSAVATCLRSPSRMAIYWGPELNCIYNDAERYALGRLHPAALGLPARRLLGLSWPIVGPQLRAVVDHGKGILLKDQPFTVDRRGPPEVAYFTGSYSPILADDEDDGVGGVLLVTEDTTERVLATRRAQTVRELSTRPLDAATSARACLISAQALTRGQDVPFALIYRIDDAGGRATCVEARAGGRTIEVARGAVALDAPSDEVSSLLRGLTVERDGGSLVPAALFVAGGRGWEMSERAFVAALAGGVTDPVLGYLVAGVRGDLVFDEAYESFLQAAAVAIGSSVAAARARETERGRMNDIAAIDRAKSALFSSESLARIAAAAAARGRIQERERHEGELRALLEDLRAAQRRVAEARDVERRRVERDLHDGAQQRLMAIRLELGLVRELLEHDPRAAGQRLDELHQELDAAVEQLRELAHGLYPPLLASDGLYAALVSVARHSVTALTVHGAEMPRAPRPIEAAVYFCCLEALQNATKHAGPGAHVSIHLKMSGEALEFRVSDDGAGFDRATVPPGYGLVNLRDRIDSLGGQVEVTSAPGRGTTVEGRIPLL